MLNVLDIFYNTKCENVAMVWYETKEEIFRIFIPPKRAGSPRALLYIPPGSLSGLKNTSTKVANESSVRHPERNKSVAFFYVMEVSSPPGVTT